MPDSLKDLVLTEKNIAAPAEWTKKGRQLDLKLPLEIDGLIEEGFFFRACAIESMPDRELMFQLEYHGLRIPGSNGPLTRFEWNTLRAHNNKGLGPSEFRFLDQHPTHVHLFEDNWDEFERALKGRNLPVARPVTQPIQSLRECLDFVGNLFKINNIEVIKTPEWVLTLDLGMK